MNEILPLIPYGATKISNNLSVVYENNEWTYYHGGLPVATHAVSDTRFFKMITSSFILNGVCRNVDIVRVFNVSKSSVIRNFKKYAAHGSDAFFKNNGKGERKSKVLTADKLTKAEELLSSQLSRSKVASELGVKYDTLNKAIQDGRIKFKSLSVSSSSSDKSSRSLTDYNAGEGIGVACTRPQERTLAAFGLLHIAETRFENCKDVTNGGVLTALPALYVNGLYHEIENCFTEFSGYYSVTHILTLLAFMSLCRIKTVEKLRWQPPGELGKLQGLDRIPEVRCLRNKLSELSNNGAAEKWGEYLTRKWMDDAPGLAGVLYVDGHVRLYSGKERLPKQYVSRERLCLKGVMDFWVNDMLGQPFFVVKTTVNPGMLQVLRESIVPRLLKEVPNQPTKEMLEGNPYLHRFIIVFDREGYSPEFFKEMWQEYRIACMTYHKYPGEDWVKPEFGDVSVKLVNGENANMKLAERGTMIGSGKNKLWVREVRKLTKSGHQTSIVSTAYSLCNMIIAVLMFARWCQENFFNYMMQHYAIDLLSDYLKEKVPDTEMVISPEWRRLEKKINSMNGKLKARKNIFADLTLHPAMENNSIKYRKWEKTKIELVEEITVLEGELAQQKIKRKSVEKHIKVIDLSEKESFQALSSSKKHLVDTIKMISYRAETAMANIIRKECGTLEQARALIRDVVTSEADLIPDKQAKTLTVRLHNLSTRAMDKKLDQLLSVLNAAEIKYPCTDLTLLYERLGT
jgi:prepilin-type processing-associated H-X9-DG protein